MIRELDTGYQPPSADLSSIDKRALFNDFARTRYIMRRAAGLLRHFAAKRAAYVALEECARNEGDLVDLRWARDTIAQLDHAAEDVRGHRRELAEHLLDFALWIDKVATLEEKAALLGLSPIAARRALSVYDGSEGNRCESFTLLLTHMPEDRPDPDIEVIVTGVVVRAITSHPIAKRRTAQYMNEHIFGADVMPVPAAPKPTLVKTGGAA